MVLAERLFECFKDKEFFTLHEAYQENEDNVDLKDYLTGLFDAMYDDLTVVKKKK